MTSPKDPEAQTKQFVIDAVQKYWDQHQKVYMLSSLGYDLKSRLPVSKAVLGEGLSDFLRQNLIVHVVQFPGVAQKIGAVPLSVTLPDDVTELFKSRENAKTGHSWPIYKQEFWNMFIRVINEGEVRVVTPNSDGTLLIEDVEQDKFVEQTGSYKIEAKDLSPVVPDRTDAEKAIATNEKISRWLSSKSLSNDIFLRVPRYVKQKGRDDRIGLLLGAFEGFSKDDLARINIPLDILTKLASSK